MPPELLGDYLPAVLDAARTGRRLAAVELARYGRSGEQAAERGVALRGLVNLFLSATWRLWHELPGLADPRAAGLGVLHAADDAVAAAAEGFERAHLSIARREEAERLEFVDDLLSGRAAADLLTRGERLGLRLRRPAPGGAGWVCTGGHRDQAAGQGHRPAGGRRGCPVAVADRDPGRPAGRRHRGGRRQ